MRLLLSQISKHWKQIVDPEELKILKDLAEESRLISSFYISNCKIKLSLFFKVWFKKIIFFFISWRIQFLLIIHRVSLRHDVSWKIFSSAKWILPLARSRLAWIYTFWPIRSLLLVLPPWIFHFRLHSYDVRWNKLNLLLHCSTCFSAFFNSKVRRFLSLKVQDFWTWKNFSWKWIPISLKKKFFLLYVIIYLSKLKIILLKK